VPNGEIGIGKGEEPGSEEHSSTEASQAQKQCPSL